MDLIVSRGGQVVSCEVCRVLGAESTDAAVRIAVKMAASDVLACVGAGVDGVRMAVSSLKEIAERAEGGVSGGVVHPAGHLEADLETLNANLALAEQDTYHVTIV